MTIDVPWRSILRVLTVVVLVCIWLADRLAPEVTADHRRIEHTKEHCQDIACEPH